MAPVKFFMIYIDGHCPVGLGRLTGDEAQGAMSFARQIYWDKCVELVEGETLELIERVEPRKVRPVFHGGLRKLLRHLKDVGAPGDLSIDGDSIVWCSDSVSSMAVALMAFEEVLKPEYRVGSFIKEGSLSRFRVERITKDFYPYPRVGVGVIIQRDGKVLLGKRKGSHGAGEWSLPGGHLEFFESLEACAKREVKEETGLEVENVRIGPYTNDFFPEDRKHYITLYLHANWTGGDPVVMEPDRCDEWRWCEKPFPEPMFTPLKNLLEQEKL